MEKVRLERDLDQVCARMAARWQQCISHTQITTLKLEADQQVKVKERDLELNNELQDRYAKQGTAHRVHLFAGVCRNSSSEGVERSCCEKPAT